MTDRKPHSAARTRTTPARKVAANKTTAKTAPAKKAAKKTAAKKTAAKKTPAKKTSAKKAAKKTAAKQTAKKAAKKTAAKQTAKKTPAKKTPKASAKKTTAKVAPKKTAAKKQPAKKSAKKTSKRPAKQAKPTKPRPPTPDLPADERARLQAILAEADATLTLSDEADAAAGGDELRERYADDTWTMGTMMSAPLWQASAEASAGLIKLAETPPRRTMDIGGVETSSVFFVDVADPGTLLFAPTADMPPVLYVQIPADVASVRTVLAEYSGMRERSVELRAWMGYGSNLRIPNVYSGELVEVDDHELDRFFCFSPVATTLSRRTYFSASKFSFEQHGEDLFIWDLAYAPCTTSAPAIAKFKQVTGYDFPSDMPVDLALAVEGFEFSTADRLEARIEGDPDSTAAILGVIAAIEWPTLATAHRLRKYLHLGDEDVEANLTNAAFRYGWEPLAWTVLRTTKNEEMQGQIAEALAEFKFAELPQTAGVRRVLAPGSTPAALHAHAHAHGWTRQDIPEDDERTTRAIYTLPDHSDEAPRRVTWIDAPALELSTLTLEGFNTDDTELDAALPAFTGSDDAWHTAAVDAWLGNDAALELLRTALTSDAWPDRLAAARLIGHARITAAKALIESVLPDEIHAATRTTLQAALDHLE